MDQTNTLKKKLLIVEDERDLLDLYVSIMEAEGFDVDRAADGELALKKILNNVYDLILLDIILPKMDGLQVLENLNKLGKLPENKIVLLTNLGKDLVMAKAVELKVRGYIIKSDYTPDQLIKEVKNYTESSTGVN